jgi:crotonobetainyl-CoA:carnitine CoA-transferase CaiB-like acyl-CoA transferase
VRQKPDRSKRGPLAGVRIVECSMLGPGAITTHLADLGADVLKVEPPTGDYAREMTWPIVEGVSLLHLHISRGKRSIVLDLRSEEGRATFLELVRGADAVVEAMRPGGLERRGVGYEACKAVNPRIVFCTISGYGMTGPYRDLPSHGIAYDAWAGLVPVEVTDDGFCDMPAHPNVGINVGPLYGALGLLAGILHARATGEGCALEVAQSDAAAAMDWLAPETYKAYERPTSEVTGNKADGYERREPGTAGMRGGVRYQFYESADGHVLFMASEQAFWRNFCEGVGRVDLFQAHPGSRYASHARGNTALRRELQGIFRTRTTAEWVQFGIDSDVPIGPVNTPETIAADPQFADRLPWLDRDVLGCEQLPFPVRFLDLEVADPTKAPSLGEHTDEVLREVLGYDDETIAAKRAGGALGS